MPHQNGAHCAQIGKSGPDCNTCGWATPVAVAGEKHEQRVVYCCSTRLRHCKQFSLFYFGSGHHSLCPEKYPEDYDSFVQNKIRTPRPVQHSCDTVNKRVTWLPGKLPGELPVEVPGELPGELPGAATPGRSWSLRDEGLELGEHLSVHVEACLKLSKPLQSILKHIDSCDWDGVFIKIVRLVYSSLRKDMLSQSRRLLYFLSFNEWPKVLLSVADSNVVSTLFQTNVYTFRSSIKSAQFLRSSSVYSSSLLSLVL